MKLLTFRSALLMLAFFLSPMLCHIAAAAPVASKDELQGMFDQGQYRELVPALNKSLADKSVLAKPDEHYALLMLKGEAMLRMKASASAQDAFHAASLVVGADDKSVSIANATVSLVKRSGNAKYQPKTKDGTSTGQQPAIDILNTDTRKQAFAALFTDLYEPAKPIVATAEKATSLEAILDVVPQLSEIRDVEIAATGSDTESKELLQELATHAIDMMNAALKPMESSLTTMSKQSSKKMRGGRTISNGGAGTAGMTSGLSPLNVDALDSNITEARKISAAADTFQSAFGDAGDFKSVKSAAEKFIDDANKLLTKYKKPTD
jgi:hypothetical protein